MTCFLDNIRCLELLCDVSKKWGLYISFADSDEFAEVLKAAPYLGPFGGNNTQILMDGQGFILCDTEEEMNALYAQTVGDDGPTKVNFYNGPARVYAITCSPDGQLLNENT